MGNWGCFTPKSVELYNIFQPTCNWFLGALSRRVGFIPRVVIFQLNPLLLGAQHRLLKFLSSARLVGLVDVEAKMPGVKK